MLRITGVLPHSIGQELEIDAGDAVIKINGHPVDDFLDYQIHVSHERVMVEIEKQDGELWDLEVEKEPENDMGLQFEHPPPHQCGNNCIFCFVHQLPRGMRSTLYVKDEDYRFSYLYGSYVTLTNIDEANVQRIIDQQLSPLYVSVHASDEQLRKSLIGRQGLPILDLLDRLTAAGIEIHTQIVLCPGINDGSHLEKTVEDLYQLRPGVLSLAIVPVGLTGYRRGLPHLRPPTAVEAQNILTLLHRYQARFREETGSRFVFAADEFYLQAGVEFPPVDDYEDLPQLENGVGLVSVFRAEGDEVLAEAQPLVVPEVSTFTGESFRRELETFAAALSRVTGVAIRVHTITNEFFGGHVTVTGLLTGRDIVRQLKGKKLGAFLLVPDVVLKEGEDLFLDDLSLAELGKELQVTVRRIPSTPWGLLEALEALAP
jgi:putative radical SAM enzyme (TIGR03279 family)